MVLIIVFWLAWTFCLLTLKSSPEGQYHPQLSEKQIIYALAVNLFCMGVSYLILSMVGMSEILSLFLMVVSIFLSLYVLLRKAYSND